MRGGTQVRRDKWFSICGGRKKCVWTSLVTLWEPVGGYCLLSNGFSLPMHIEMVYLEMFGLWSCLLVVLYLCVAWSGQVVERCKTLSAGNVKFKRAVIVTGGECLHVTTQVPREEVSQISQKAPKTTTVWSQSDDSILVWKTTLNTRNSIKDPLRWVPGN